MLGRACQAARASSALRRASAGPSTWGTGCAAGFTAGAAAAGENTAAGMGAGFTAAGVDAAGADSTDELPLDDTRTDVATMCVAGACWVFAATGADSTGFFATAGAAGVNAMYESSFVREDPDIESLPAERM